MLHHDIVTRVLARSMSGETKTFGVKVGRDQDKVFANVDEWGCGKSRRSVSDAVAEIAQGNGWSVMGIARWETAHGYPVIARKDAYSEDSEIVIAYRDEATYHKYAVWRMHRETGICEGGNYLGTFEEAREYFEGRK